MSNRDGFIVMYPRKGGCGNSPVVQARAAPGERAAGECPALGSVDRWTDLLDRAADAGATAVSVAQAAVAPFDPCFILYTSGSTSS